MFEITNTKTLKRIFVSAKSLLSAAADTSFRRCEKPIAYCEINGYALLRFRDGTQFEIRPA